MQRVCGQGGGLGGAPRAPILYTPHINKCIPHSSPAHPVCLLTYSCSPPHPPTPLSAASTASAPRCWDSCRWPPWAGTSWAHSPSSLGCPLWRPPARAQRESGLSRHSALSMQCAAELGVRGARCGGPARACRCTAPRCSRAAHGFGDVQRAWCVGGQHWCLTVAVYFHTCGCSHRL